jgi:hypothetical protein
MRVFATTLLLLCLAAAPRLAGAQEMNACGCYRDDSGACKCTNKKAKCACPGDCEPVGCEARREKEASREADATLKKIQARERKKAAEAARDTKQKTRAAAKNKKQEEALQRANARQKAKPDKIEDILQGK